MIRLGGVETGAPGEDTEFRGLWYPDGDELSKHMVARLQQERFYQCDKFDLSMQFVKRFRAAIDCGAWVGAWSLAMAERFGHVLAIEANPDNARCVERNTGSAGGVQVANVAVGDHDGHCRVAPFNNGPAVGSRIVSDGDARTVTMVRLDNIENDEVDYVKVHVNGMELAALKGAAKLIARCKPVITVVAKNAIKEFGSTPDDVRAFMAGALGYQKLAALKPYEVWGPR